MIRKTRNQYESGFTIIELLVVLIVMVSIGGVVGSIFFISLRSAKKSNTIAIVRQNGNSVITKMSRDIRYAKNVIGLSSDGVTFDKACTKSPDPVVSYQYIKLGRYDMEIPEIVYYCPQNNVLPADNDAIQSGMGGKDGAAISLTPITDPVVAKVKDCQISCINQSSGATSVNISFKMIDPNNGAGVFESTVQPIIFDTSITLRNY